MMSGMINWRRNSATLSSMPRWVLLGAIALPLALLPGCKKEAEPHAGHHSASAGDMAGDLMKQTVAAEKARRHGDAPDHHHHEKKPGFGVTDVAMYSAKKAIPIVVGTVLLVGGAFWLSSTAASLGR